MLNSIYLKNIGEPNFLSSLEDSGLKCPLTKNPLYFEKILSSDKTYFFSIDKENIEYIYIKKIDIPYYELADEIGNLWKYRNSSKSRYWLPNEDGTWSEFKNHSDWIIGDNVFLPIEITGEELEEILDFIRSNTPALNSFPVITKIIAKTIAFDLVSVKPLNGPSCNLFYLGGQKKIEKRKNKQHHRKKSKNKKNGKIRNFRRGRT